MSESIPVSALPSIGKALVEDARRRIGRVRMVPVRVLVTRDGRPAPGARVRLTMKNHAFLFGAVCYHYGRFPTAQMNERFSRLFTPLFNYTMMPVHWDWYEPKRGEYGEEYIESLLGWAERHGIKRKMHALLWHECVPEWLTQGMDVKALYEERVTHLMRRYKGRFDFHDVVNESTVCERFDNPVARWMMEYGLVNVAKLGVSLARAVEPDAKLIYGEWNVHGQAYLDFLRDLRENGVGIDCIGIQSHMHRDVWTGEETLRVMDEAAKFGWPIHFPEVSLCSGRPIGTMAYQRGHNNRFVETPEDAAWQAEFARDFYTLVFSHPAVEALSWFDFVDHRWLGAPAGVVTDDLEPKPIYHALTDLLHREWRSDMDASADGDGAAAGRLFFGRYLLEAELDGRKASAEVEFARPSFYEGGGEERVVRIGI
ncbi:MAG TPA: endo-1,4-beta-xylanase [Candidatus Limnocylindria bacterium]|nr:endo-1,4-beta-xylanase [Candidatus Limnocylindria bacterium]